MPASVTESDPLGTYPLPHTSDHVHCPACRRSLLMLEPGKLRHLTFREAAPLWLDSHRLQIAPRSLLDYENCIKALAKFFSALPLGKIHIGHFEEYQKMRAETVGASRINHELNTLSQILNRAELWAPIRPHYKPMRLPQTGPERALTEQEADYFIRVASSRPRWKIAFLCSVLTAHTTAGPSEILNLRLQDVDLEERTITVVGGAKNIHRVRTIPLNRDALHAVEELLDQAREKGAALPAHYLLPHRADHAGTRADPTRPATSWKKAMSAIRAEAAKRFPVLATVKPYYWRFHSITRLLEANGIPERSVMELAGHVSRKMLEHYSRIRMDAKRTAVEALEKKPVGSTKLAVVYRRQE